MDRKVHIRDAAGRPLYNRLIDRPGENVMTFDSPGGFIAKDQCKRERWQICAGWIAAEDFGQGRRS